MFDSPKYQNKETKQHVKDVLDTFETFGFPMELVDVVEARYELRIYLRTKKPTRMTEIEKFQKDLAYSLGTKDVYIQAPVPDKKLIGVVIPSDKPVLAVTPEVLLESRQYLEAKGNLLVPVGLTEFNEPLVEDMTAWPHILIAGTTGGGKSNWLHHVLTTLVERYEPHYLQLLIIDPKNIEFSGYEELPHLLTPPISDMRKGLLALKWLTSEMDRRYDLLREAKVHSIVEYRQRKKVPEPMPYILTVVDEMADCMTAYPREYEASLVRLLQMCRAVGIHLILSTQRPSVQCITGLIRANIPTRMAFTVASMIDSRTILDQAGAEKLRGTGDALFLRTDYNKAIRIQTPLISRVRVSRVVDEVRSKFPEYERQQPQDVALEPSFADTLDDNELDELYEAVREFVTQEQKATTSLIQRRFKVGYGRSARIIDQLAERGVIEQTNSASGSPWRVLQPRPSVQEPVRKSVGTGKAIQAVLVKMLGHFNVQGEVVDIKHGYSYDRYTLEGRDDAFQSRILTLRLNFELALARSPVFVGVVQGSRSRVYLDIPRTSKRLCKFTKVEQALSEVNTASSKKPCFEIPLGMEFEDLVTISLEETPALLIAGHTAGGKSNFFHVALVSLMHRHTPDDVRFVCIDMKRIELTQHNGSPYLATSEAVTSVEAGVRMLEWVVSQVQTREKKKKWKGPALYVCIDELSDLICAHPKKVEKLLVYIATRGAAVSVYIAIASSRADAGVFTEVLKRAFSSKLVFKVSDPTISETILGQSGAEFLLGYGDGFYLSQEEKNPQRIQVPFIQIKEVKQHVQRAKKRYNQEPLVDLNS